MAKNPQEKKKAAPKREPKPRPAKIAKAPAKARAPRKPKGSPGKAARKRDAPENFNWIIDKLENKDPYFSLDYAINFLHDLFSHLVAHCEVSQADVDKFVDAAEHPVTLGAILKHFNVKK